MIPSYLYNFSANFTFYGGLLKTLVLFRVFYNIDWLPFYAVLITLRKHFTGAFLTDSFFVLKMYMCVKIAFIIALCDFRSPCAIFRGTLGDFRQKLSVTLAERTPVAQSSGPMSLNFELIY